METIRPNSSRPYTILDDRVLWYDGDSSYTTESLVDRILNGDTSWMSDYVVDDEEYSVKKANQLDENINLRIKTDVNIPRETLEWKIPDKYKTMCIKRHVYTKLSHEFNKRKFNARDENIRIERVRDEFTLWESNGMEGLLRTLIFVIDTFDGRGIIWGTGRGSSCCSYILYLIGVHDVDSVKYDLDTTDFFR